MAVIVYLHTALRHRLTELRRQENADRGDSPVPTVIIIAGLAVLAVVVLGVASTAIEDWKGLIPDAVAP